jgi:hypothetical protein
MYVNSKPFSITHISFFKIKKKKLCFALEMVNGPFPRVRKTDIQWQEKPTVTVTVA